ncbi:hypothetical protein R1sor_017987 [Riccia sorocarpa]|uniref:MORN repeat-containing protein 3 n=1 Tax=Riccia sorocarpa TaxID=122646 RepID=A0ABD3IC48_9MARC
MEADDPSAARDAAVSPSNETASESFAEPETSASSLGISEELGPFGAENVSGSYLSDGYQEDHAEEISSNRGKVGGASGSIDYNEQEPMEFLSIPGPPQPSTGDGANPPGQQQEGQNADPQALAVVIDRSAAVSAAKMSSEASSSIAPLSVGVPAMEEEVYSGMPKVDADIEVGKNIVRRRKLSAACPPSSLYADVQPPGMEMVQRALRNHKTTIQPFKKQQPRYQATEYHDERGHMLLYGSLDGKYVGDVLGGLPHGHGQHWTPSPGGKAAPGYRHLLYEGAWKYGAKCGFGRMFYHNGQYYKDGGFYKGAWCKDNRDGWGAYYWPNKCRKYEGEWVGDDPVCGNHTKIQESDYMALKNLIPEWCNVQGYFPANLPKETLELPAMELRYPESVYYPHACGRRQERIDIKQAAEKHPPDPKIGKRLFVALQEAAIPTVGLTYNNLMKTLLKFQYPREPATYTRNESLRKE